MIYIANINHNWRLENESGKERAIGLAVLAANSGADIVEFPIFNQLYRDPDRQSAIEPYKLPHNWLPEIKEAVEDNGAELSLSLYDPVNLPVKCNYYSVDSYNLDVQPLLEYLSKKDASIFLSTGSADFMEVDDAIEALRPGDEAPEDLYLLHHSPGESVDDLNLRRVMDLGVEFFPLHIGYEPNTVSPWLVASTVLYHGEIIKVKFNDGDESAIDASRSYGPKELRQLIESVNIFDRAKSCSCQMTLADTRARSMYRRDKKDWLRPERDEED